MEEWCREDVRCRQGDCIMGGAGIIWIEKRWWQDYCFDEEGVQERHQMSQGCCAEERCLGGVQRTSEWIAVWVDDKHMRQ